MLIMDIATKAFAVKDGLLVNIFKPIKIQDFLKGDYIRQYPNSIGMFKKIIVDKAINQVSVRYNIKVNRGRKEKAPTELQLYQGTS